MVKVAKSAGLPPLSFPSYTRRSEIVPAQRTSPAPRSSVTRLKYDDDDVLWEEARRKAELAEAKEWADALARAKALAAEDEAHARAVREDEEEAREWARVMAEAKQRAAREQEEWSARRSIAAGPIPYEVSIRPAPKQTAPRISFWP